MTRIRSAPDAASTGGFLAGSTMAAYATGAIAANELCMSFEGAYISRVDPSLPWNAINQNVPVVALYPAQTSPNISLTGGTQATSVGVACALTNNVFCVPLQLNGGGIGFHIRGQHGQQLTQYIQVSSDACNVAPFVCPINSGAYFAILYVTGTTLKCGIYTNQGVQITAVFNVATNVYVSGKAPWFSACQALATGGLFIHWGNSSAAFVGQFFTIAGVTVGSQIGIDTSVNCELHACQPCSNGDIFCQHFDTSHSRHKFYRILANGTVAWGPVIPSTIGAPFSQPINARWHPPQSRLCELQPAGNLCCMLPDTDNYCKGFVLNPSTGATIAKCDPGPTYHDTGCAHPLIQTPNGFCFPHTNNINQNTYLSCFDFSGNPLSSNVICDQSGEPPPSGVTPVCDLYGSFASTQLSIMRYWSASGQIELRHVICDKLGNPVYGSAIVHQPATAGNDMSCPHPTCLPTGTTFCNFFSTGPSQLTCLSFKIGRSSIIGVAVASAANGAAVTINGAGFFQLPSSQVFGPGQAFDQRMSPVFGCVGMVGNSTAILGGWFGGIYRPNDQPPTITAVPAPPPPTTPLPPIHTTPVCIDYGPLNPPKNPVAQ